jgi:RHS repeat-associated protein
MTSMYGPSEFRIEQINNTTGTVTYLHHDQAGSTRLLTGSTGKTEATFTYGPYGETTGSTGTATTPLGFDGEYTSPDTGLIYLRNRVYDPKTAQFLTVDPLKALSGEPYSYAGDNPLTYGDPTGLIFGIPGTPSWEEAGEAVAGWGDTITFGATKWVREQIGDENVDTCSGAYQSGGVAGLVTGVFIPGEDDAEAGEAAEWAWKTRADEGADGGISEYGEERLEGETISTAHRVELEDEVIHQHQTHIGKYGGERQFPNEWIQYPDVEAP